MGVWHGLEVAWHRLSKGAMLGPMALARGGWASAVMYMAWAKRHAGHQPLTGRMLRRMAWAKRRVRYWPSTGTAYGMGYGTGIGRRQARCLSVWHGPRGKLGHRSSTGTMLGRMVWVRGRTGISQSTGTMLGRMAWAKRRLGISLSTATVLGRMAWAKRRLGIGSSRQNPVPDPERVGVS